MATPETPNPAPTPNRPAPNRPAPNRTDRRRAKTRQALIDAARTLIADGRAATVSIADITATADVGFGTFYNHFDDKKSLFDAAIDQILEALGDHLDTIATRAIDPAEVFATSFRHAGRLAISHRQTAEIIDSYGFVLMGSPTGLGPRARRDLADAVAAGRLRIENIDLATAITCGHLLALVHAWLADPVSVTDADVDASLETLLRSFGMAAVTARRLAHRDLLSID
ncbi:TetR/AcrR family transcriptional regulator [Williamsia sp. MIQD14]|uniref:TetR/AcrR family transcriptional regulator n=1 Tax=Williamsia sp. MIQD14 TaxID=3425703 RepID=UPI003DA031C0